MNANSDWQVKAVIVACRDLGRMMRAQGYPAVTPDAMDEEGTTIVQALAVLKKEIDRFLAGR